MWVSPDEALRIPFSRARPDLLLLASQHDICLNGDSLAYIESIGLAPFVIPLVQARTFASTLMYSLRVCMLYSHDALIVALDYILVNVKGSCALSCC